MWWIILLIIFALIFLFFWQSIHVIISYNGTFELYAGLGFIRFNILKLLDKMINKPKEEKKQTDKAKKEKEKPKKEPEPEEEKPEKSNIFKDVIELRGVDGAVDLISEFASLLSKFGGGLVKHFIIRELTVHYYVTGKDAANTAERFGSISAAVFPALGIISTTAKVKKHDIVIVPDYLGQVDTQEVKIHFSYRLLSLIAVALGAVKDFLSIMKKEKGINARIRARAKAKAMAQAKKEIEQINQGILNDN